MVARIWSCLKPSTFAHIIIAVIIDLMIKEKGIPVKQENQIYICFWSIDWLLKSDGYVKLIIPCQLFASCRRFFLFGLDLEKDSAPFGAFLC